LPGFPCDDFLVTVEDDYETVPDELDERWDAPLTQEQWNAVAWVFQSDAQLLDDEPGESAPA